MNIQPLKHNVLIFPETEADKEKTEAGIYLPEATENTSEKPQIGKILAIGDSKKIQVKIGQKVIYNKYAGTEISLDGEDLIIIKSDEILAVVK